MLDDRGVATLEYAFCALCAAAFAGVLYVVISRGWAANALKTILDRALAGAT
ncbi:DUF4244 domain-containing protein [Actinosynnema pretiosum subsp. pretiosum]|uniref:DUF4244 domain-containing protein n=1 Tax=Actinosynnema pretiosum subsp. pretiosum TaxID=103721 RepID=A0AA45L2K9_9PSEU|nr:DUF4244 domain-containing protein [Actinosynnema pretiosum subsp. pretiosum]